MPSWLRISLLFVALAISANAQEFVPATIVGTVTDSTGQPLAAAAVRWNRVSDAQIDLKKPRSTISGADGRYELNIWIEKDKTLNVREVFAEFDGYVLGESPADIPLRGGDTAKIDFELTKGELFAGTIQLPLLPAEQKLNKATQEAALKRIFLISGPNLQT